MIRNNCFHYHLKIICLHEFPGLLCICLFITKKSFMSLLMKSLRNVVALFLPLLVLTVHHHRPAFLFAFAAKTALIPRR